GPAGTGLGRAALVTGEPGIGKTRITEALTTEGRRLGVRIGVGAWDAEAGSPPLWGWSCAVRGLVGHLGDVELRALLGDTAADLAPLVSTVATGPERAGGLDAESAGFRLGSAVLDLLRVLGAQAPTLLVLDDLHWADPDSLRLLRTVVSGLAGVPALVVGTSREAEADIGPHLAETLAALARHDPLRVRLHGLTAADVAVYVRERHGTAISEAGARAIRDRTDGNPFYVAELVGLLAGEGGLEDAAGAASRAIPDGVRDIVRARLAQLPDGADRVLAVASVAGRAFDLDLVAVAAQLPSGQVLDAVEAAVVRGIVVEDAAVPDRFRFTHSLFREAVYARIAAPRRALLHAATADALERLRVGRLQEHLAELADHYSRAGPSCARAAWSFASRAGAQAESQAAHDEAARLYGEALAALTLDPFVTPRERYALLVRLGGARARTGQPASAWAALESAARGALEAGDVAGAARAVLVVTVDPLWTWRPYPTVDPDAIALVTELLDRLPPGNDALRAQLLAMLAVELLYDAGSGSRCADLAGEATALAADGAPDVLLHVLELSWMALQLRPDLLHRRAALTEERVRVAQLLPDPVATARGLTARSAAHVEQGHLEQGWADLDRAAALAERHRAAPVAMVIAWAQALRPFVAGDFDTAEREIARLRDVHSDVSMSGGGLWLLQLAQLRAVQGRLGELAPALDEWMLAWPALRDLRALATVASEGVEAARALLGPWPSQPRLVLDYTWTNFMVVRAQLWGALGDPDALRSLRSDLAPFADRVAYGGTGMMFGGFVGHTLGELALGCGDAEAAVGHLRVALARHRENGCVPHTALSRWALAAALRARRDGDDEEAAALAAQARSEAARLGLHLPGAAQAPPLP
ncbi:MAG: AAA family ATPase, partial [Pseudonocardia sp.]|nr:AAA family ATPase [Pseudonocardia sp.]